MTKRTFADSPSDPTTTLGAQLTAGQTTVTLATDPGIEMPTTGPFTVLIGDSPNTEAANCASRSGTTITLITAWAGATHAAGSSVNTGLAKIDAEAFIQQDDLTAAPVSTAQQAALDGKVAKAGDTMTGVLKHPAGTAGAPSVAVRQSNVGMYSPSAGTGAVTASGVETLRWTSSVIQTKKRLEVGAVFGFASEYVDMDALGGSYVRSNASLPFHTCTNYIGATATYYLNGPGSAEQQIITNDGSSSDAIYVTSSPGITLMPGDLAVVVYDITLGNWRRIN